jgi:hypothetical protein
MNQFLKYLCILTGLTFSSLTLFSQSPLNWARDEINPGEDFTLSADDSFFTEGDRSLHMQLHTGAVPYLVSDVFYITPGFEYEFSIDVFDNDTSGQVKVYADFYDPYGFDIFGQPPVFSADSAEWQTISWEGTIPSQAVVGYILVKFYCQPDLYHFSLPAGIWIDHVQFKQAGGDNLVNNGGFENWNVGLEESGNEDEAFTVYPNPAKDFLNIDLPGNASEVIISDMTGREVYRENISGRNQIQVDLHEWIEGVYIINLVPVNGLVRAKKLIVL